MGESAIVPTYVVNFSGCNMRCRFCLTGESSQDAAAGNSLDVDGIVERILGADESVRSVTILGGEPTIHLPAFLDLAARIPRSLDLVLKTNAYMSEEGRGLLEGIPDIVLADYKFGNDGCARRLAGVPDYTHVVRQNLEWAARTGRLVIRHLLMPGHLECCFVPVAEWIGKNAPEAGLSLLTDFLPVFKAASVPGLGRFNRPAEIERARAYAAKQGVRLVPFAWAPSGRDLLPKTDEIWIDPSGRICFDSASSSLVSLLEILKPDL